MKTEFNDLKNEFIDLSKEIEENEWMPKTGEKVLVNDNDEGEFSERTYLFSHNGRHFCLSSKETHENWFESIKNDDEYFKIEVYLWRCIKQIPQILPTEPLKEQFPPKVKYTSKEILTVSVTDEGIKINGYIKEEDVKKAISTVFDPADASDNSKLNKLLSTMRI